MTMIKDALFGLAVGDAIGVPVEFKTRDAIAKNLVTDMIGYGTYNLPAGTWSDDSSLAFCLAEALVDDFDLSAIAINFQRWFYSNYWTARGEVFDIGITTREAIDRLTRGFRPDLAGGFEESENGNGSLMRILPLLFYIKGIPIGKRFQLIKLVSSITHGHIRSVIACFYYLEFAAQLVDGKNKYEIYETLRLEIPLFLSSIEINPTEIHYFARLLTGNIYDLPESEIFSTGYVLHTLEASIWCLLTTNSYQEAVLKAVNLGLDTDTTGCVTGGIAGLLYGISGIPDKWINLLARRNDIEDLAERLTKRFNLYRGKFGLKK
jgi:ADP-ribosyl-[dinitrogen reductase] hydrolase